MVPKELIFKHVNECYKAEAVTIKSYTLDDNNNNNEKLSSSLVKKIKLWNSIAENKELVPSQRKREKVGASQGHFRSRSWKQRNTAKQFFILLESLI